ncbi:hypothetical protein [Shimia sp. SK013]|nr:hypothetical protein [Shimia sp. SK013]
MTNPIAVFLVLLILTGLGVDVVFNGGDATLVIVRKFFELIEWVAFWR